MHRCVVVVVVLHNICIVLYYILRLQITALWSGVAFPFVRIMSSFSCQCERVTVTFPNDTHQARVRLQCCCCDCYQKLEWAASNGGPPLHGTHISKHKPLCGEIWDARLTVTGKKYLKFNKLHADADSTNCVASCCSTVLFVDHPIYGGKCVLIFPEFLKMQGSSRVDRAVLTTFYKDWSEKDQQKLDFAQVPGACYENGDFNGMGEWKEALGHLMESYKSLPVGDGQSFEQLFDETGCDVENLGFKPRTCH